MTLVYLGLGWLAGLALAAACPLKWPLWLVLSLGPIAAAFLQPRRRRLYLSLAFVFLGAARYRAGQPRFGPADLATYNGRGWGEFQGTVVDEPDPRAGSTRLTVEMVSVHLEGDTPRPVSGRALLEAPRYPALHYGDRLRFSGRLQTPREGFYQDYLARQQIYSIVRRPQIEVLPGRGGSLLKRTLFGLKAEAQARLRQILPDPEVSLLSGVLLGNEQGIPGTLMEDFNATGATHVIAISGFNISIIVALLLTWLGRVIPRRRAGIVTIAVIAAYTVFVGADAAVVRAAVMGSLLTVGSLLGRQTFGPASLMAAAIAMTCAQPLLLWDVGFQLSCVATLGLMLYVEPLQKAALWALEKRLSPAAAGRLVRLLNDSLLVTTAAQITTLPLIAYQFGRVSPVSLLTNLLILPVQPALMIVGGVAAVAGLLWLPLGQVLGWLSYPFLWWTIRVVEATASVPSASVAYELSGAGLLAVYGGLFGLTWFLSRPALVRRAWLVLAAQPWAKLSLASAAASLALGIGFISSRPDGRLHVTFLDVGEGESILIQTPAGRTILVDGGPDPAVLLSQLGRRLGLWSRWIDVVVATHPDAAHVNGLPAVLESYRVGALITNGEEEGLPAWEELLALAEQERVPLVTAVSGQTIKVGDGVVLEVLHPGSPGYGAAPAGRDNNSIVLQLRYGEASFLLAGDVEADVEARLIEAGAPLQSIVLKAADGGDRDGTTQGFLEAVNPWVVVFSAGDRNPRRHPAPKVVERVEVRGTAIARTDQMGSLHFVTDGRRLWVEAERP